MNDASATPPSARNNPTIFKMYRSIHGPEGPLLHSRLQQRQMAGERRNKEMKLINGATLLAAFCAFAAISATPTFADDMGKMGKMDMSRYGGAVYSGAPALDVTASLVQA